MNELFDPDRPHHVFSPSGSSRWLSCGMSVWEEFDKPDTSNPSSTEGTRLHALAEDHLNNNTDNEEIQYYLDYVRSLGGRLWVEQRIDLNEWIPNCKGTADAIVLNDTTLHIVDLKTGQIPVAATTTQMQLYAIGALLKMEQADIEITSVVCHIVQPNNVNSHEHDIDQLFDFALHVREWVQKCANKEVDYVPNESNCRYCKGAATCEKLYQQQLAVVQGDFEVLPSPESLTPNQLSLVLKNKKLLESWLTKVEEYLIHQATLGANIPGFKLVESRTRRQFKPEAEDVLLHMLGKAAYKPQELIGITAAEKLVGKKQVAELTIKPEGKPTLAPLSDKRPEINLLSDFEEL